MTLLAEFRQWRRRRELAGALSPDAMRAVQRVELGLWSWKNNRPAPAALVRGLAEDVAELERALARPQ
jgi:hypothetical protein